MGYKSQKKEVMISSEIGKEIIKKEVPLIPKLPGVYKMLSDKDQILYVQATSVEMVLTSIEYLMEEWPD